MLIVTFAIACAVTIFAPHGHYVRTPQLHGPGLLLDGAGITGSPVSSIAWLHRRLVGSKAPGGNVVVLRASYSDVYDRPFWQYGNFASVQTVLIPPCATHAQVDRVATIVDRADAVYFAGGDQAHYVAWKDTALMHAVKQVYARGGVIGGGSAGLAIQGAVVYDSVTGDRRNEETTTADAVRDPFEPRISFTTGLFAWPALAGTITDTHFVARNRFGRSVVFLARILHEDLLPGARTAYALGVDQGSAVVVDPDGTATVLNNPGAGGAYLIRAGTPPHLTAGQPLRYTVSVAHLARNGERVDLLRKTTTEPWYTVTVDGARTPPYSRDPYVP
ncbi:MAG: Type 1 glutamine amidotransferase-like domain-containing protein [Candidatus Eremiobacteraeota bacterium]|nr:Type 1 glutamine amidotransferase-like domain-containing protein [Candidatus Eremiobacteraeota bacterium]